MGAWMPSCVGIVTVFSVEKCKSPKERFCRSTSTSVNENSLKYSFVSKMVKGRFQRYEHWKKKKKKLSEEMGCGMKQRVKLGPKMRLVRLCTICER